MASPIIYGIIAAWTVSAAGVEYTNTPDKPYLQPTYAQIIVDKKTGAAVLFSEKELGKCNRVAQDVVNSMLQNPYIIPLYAKCVPVTVD